MASPVAAGAAVLLSSILPERERRTVLNPAVMKQVLVEGATRLPNAHRSNKGREVGLAQIGGDFTPLRPSRVDGAERI